MFHIVYRCIKKKKKNENLERKKKRITDSWRQFYSAQLGVGFINKITAEEENMKKLREERGIIPIKLKLREKGERYLCK